MGRFQRSRRFGFQDDSTFSQFIVSKAGKAGYEDDRMIYPRTCAVTRPADIKSNVSTLSHHTPNPIDGGRKAFAIVRRCDAEGITGVSQLLGRRSGRASVRTRLFRTSVSRPIGKMSSGRGCYFVCNSRTGATYTSHGALPHGSGIGQPSQGRGLNTTCEAVRVATWRSWHPHPFSIRHVVDADYRVGAALQSPARRNLAAPVMDPDPILRSASETSSRRGRRARKADRMTHSFERCCICRR